MEIIIKIKYILTKLYVIVRRPIIVTGYFFFENKKLLNYNFGDDLAFHLLSGLTGKKVYAEPQLGVYGMTKLASIGSILGFAITRNTLVWGSGFISTEDKVIKPQKICAVRGPLTMHKYLENGIYCPEIFGDPALLLPYIYSPKVTKKYKVGIIPHYVDYDLPFVKKFRECHPDILFIRMNNYTNWQEVINQILSCEKIASSSLHGLIVSDAYGIPNVRVVFSDSIVGGDFKYKDYYYGVGRDFFEPIDWKKEILLDDFFEACENYKVIHYNPKYLLASFPYKLLEKYRKIANLS